MQTDFMVRAGTRSLGLLGLMLALAAPPAGAAGTGVQAEPDWPPPINDQARYAKLLVDRLEYVGTDEENRLDWDAQFWYGGDIDRLWIETEGEEVGPGEAGGELENFDFQYSRRFAPFWDVQAGLGYQRQYGPGPDRDRSYAVVGLQGLAPYWFEVDADLRLSEDGDAAVDVEAEYDWLLTQRLILQPRLEAAYAFEEVERFGVGQGLNTVQLGLRLRYEVRRELAPYVGIEWARKFGETRDLARTDGEDASETRLVAGLRIWF